MARRKIPYVPMCGEILDGTRCCPYESRGVYPSQQLWSAVSRRDNWPILERFVLCSEVIFDPVFGLWMKAPPTGSLSCSSGRLEALSWVVRLMWPLNIYLNLFLKGTETNSIMARAIFQRNPIESSQGMECN